MDDGIFSTYRQGENRVTASILAVLRSLALSRIEHILGALLQESEFQLVRFENQISGSGGSVPDGEIAADVRILLETKTTRNELQKKQLISHLGQLGSQKGSRLLVLTPDFSEPPLIKEINDKHKRVVWASFADLDEAINDVLNREKEVVSEREEFLLRELQKMLDADGLLRSAQEVVVVAARLAWPVYKNLHAYVTKANRSFRNVEYVAFYSEGQIHPIVPRILLREPEVELKPELHTGALRQLVQRVAKGEAGYRPEKAMVLLLSSPDDPKTVKLGQPIRNDLQAAFVQGQRYVSLAALRVATGTKELTEQSE